jgi:hypothetical protein
MAMVIDAAKEVILGNMVFKVEGVEKTLLVIPLKPNHIGDPG